MPVGRVEALRYRAPTLASRQMLAASARRPPGYRRKRGRISYGAVCADVGSRFDHRDLCGAHAAVAGDWLVCDALTGAQSVDARAVKFIE
jgi:hypothetical protein